STATARSGRPRRASAATTFPSRGCSWKGRGSSSSKPRRRHAATTRASDKRRARIMSSQSSIEWTDATWNPVRGCTKISPGCARCSAEGFAERFRGVAGSPYEQGFDLRLVPEMLPEPIRWTKPKTVFVNSMSDLFHEGVPDDFIAAVVRVMERANWHTYQ